jgi:cyclopropane fatty-acyl-phospholipid synthase-like methyltransferase
MAKDKQKTGKTGRNKVTRADVADKHVLYEQAVQCVEAEIDFIEKTFETIRKRPARQLREDFCGTTNTSCEWVRRHQDNTAWCVDIDQEVLEWGRKNNIAKLSAAQAERIHILNEDVMQVQCAPVDVVLAMNFSYWLFKTRQSMGEYFRKVWQGLHQDGVFFLDAFGGFEAFQELEESTKYKGFTYIWDQANYDPVTGDARMHIHFRFPDGSRLDKAFSYDWRLWTLPEITEVLQEAGFKPTVYWEGEDKNGEGNGIFKPVTRGEADAGWIAYIVAEK